MYLSGIVLKQREILSGSTHLAGPSHLLLLSVSAPVARHIPRFDEMRPSEPQRRKGKGLRRAFKSVTGETSHETQNQLKILNSVRSSRSKGIVFHLDATCRMIAVDKACIDHKSKWNETPTFRFSGEEQGACDGYSVVLPSCLLYDHIVPRFMNQAHQFGRRY